MLDLPVGHRGEPGEHVAQVGVGIDAAAAATLDNGVKDGAAPAACPAACNSAPSTSAQALATHD